MDRAKERMLNLSDQIACKEVNTKKLLVDIFNRSDWRILAKVYTTEHDKLILNADPFIEAMVFEGCQDPFDKIRRARKLMDEYHIGYMIVQSKACLGALEIAQYTVLNPVLDNENHDVTFMKFFDLITFLSVIRTKLAFDLRRGVMVLMTLCRNALVNQRMDGLMKEVREKHSVITLDCVSYFYWENSL